jgi:4-alpha-glucanotransferase
MLVRDDGAFRHEALWRGAAVALPVFALRTADSLGCGEFEDLRQLVDLCHTTGASPAFPACYL